MNAVTRTLGQAVAAAAVAVALLLGGVHSQGAEAAVNKDTRPMGVKVRELKELCEATNGTFTDRPSSTDSDKRLTKCEGGGLATVGCILTPTTSECLPIREMPTEWWVPELVDDAGLGATSPLAPHMANPTNANVSQSVAALDDNQDQDTGNSMKGKKGKKGGKGRKK